MKISAVFPKKSNSPFIYEKSIKSERKRLELSDKLLIVSAAVLFCGIAAGALLFRTNSSYMSNEIYRYFISFSTDFSGKSYIEILSGFLSVNVLFFCVAAILGTSALGDIPVFVLTFFKASGIGALTSYLYSTYGLRGFEYFILVLFPGKIFLVISMLLLAQSSSMSSIRVRKCINKLSQEEYDLKVYLLRSLFILILIIVSCLVDSVAIKLFSPLFSLS